MNSKILPDDYTEEELEQFLVNDVGFDTDDFIKVMNDVDALRDVFKHYNTSEESVEKFIRVIKRLAGSTSDEERFDRAMGIIE